MAHERLAALVSDMREAAALPAESGRDQQFGNLLREAVMSEDALGRPEHAAALAHGRKALDLGAYHIAIPAIGRALFAPAPRGQSWDRQDDLRAICDAIAEQIESASEPEATSSVEIHGDMTGDRQDVAGSGKVSWKAARHTLEERVKRNEGVMPRVAELARIAGCSRSTIYKAINNSVYLSARYAESKRRGREVSLSDTTLENTPQTTEPDPAKLERLIEEQEADELQDARQPRARKRQI